MTPAKPSLDLLRTMTDDTVLRLLMQHGRLTRAEIAARSGISKTTISESMRRLEADGVVADTGERTSGRGRSGSYYSLATGRGSAMAVSITPRSVVAELVDPGGAVLLRAEAALGRDPSRGQVSRALTRACRSVRAASDGPVLAVVVSAADPVDRETGRLVQLPDAPFLVGDLDPVAVLRPLAHGDILVDNDVNWAARAEQRLGSAVGVDDFVYVYLGEGLGCAVVTDGEVRRGHSGVAGEIAHIAVPGLSARAVAFTEVFAQLHMRRPASTAIDVEAVNHALHRDGRAGDRMRGAVADAVGAVLRSAVGFADPELLVIGGPWGTHPRLLRSLRQRVDGWPRPVRLAEAAVQHEPDLHGARSQAIEMLRDGIVSRSHVTG